MKSSSCSPPASLGRDDGCVTKLKVLADGTRLAVLRRLLARPHRVGELAEALGIEQSLMSHHLRTLRDAGLVDAEREGKGMLYRLAADVGGSPAGRVLDLGCCRLSFER